MKPHNLAAGLLEILNHSPAVTYIAAVDGPPRVLFISDSIEDLLGYRAERFQSDPALLPSIILEDSTEGMDQSRQTALRDGSVLNERRVRHAKGHDVWIRDHFKIVRSPGGRARYAVGSIVDITAERQARDQLARTANEFRILAEHSDDVISRTSIEGAMLYVSPAFNRILGRSHTGNVYTGPSKTTDQASVREASKRAIKSRATERTRFQAKHEDGSWVWFDARITPVFDAQDRVTEFVSVSRAITEQVEAETVARLANEALAAKAAELERVLDSTSDIITRHALDGKILFVSSAWTRILGAKPDEVVGHSPADWNHEEDRPLISEAFRAVKETREPQIVSSRARHADGRWLWLETTMSPVIAPETGELVEIATASRDVTERRLAEDQLTAAQTEIAERTKLFQLLTEHSSDIVARLTPEGIPAYVSPAHKAVFGYEAEPGAPLTLTVHPDDVEMATAAFRRAAASRRPQSVRYRRRHIDGHYVWIDLSISPVFDEATGRLREFVTTGRDVSRTVEAERRINAASAEVARRAHDYQTLMDACPGLITRCDGDGVIQFASAAITAMLGYQPSEWVGRRVEFLHPDDLPGQTEYLKRLRRGEKVPPVRLRIRHKDGHYVWIDHALNGKYDTASGRLTEIVSVSRDITAEVAKEESLAAATIEIARQREEMRLLVDSTADIISRWDREGRCIQVYGAAARSFGFNTDDLAGQNFEPFCDPQDFPAVAQAFIACLRDRKVQRVRYRQFHADGARRWWEANLSPFPESGDVQEVISIARDITAQVVSEERLATAQKDLSEQRAAYQFLVENSADIIARHTVEGETVYVSPRAAEMTGYAPDEIVSMKSTDLIDAEDVPAVVDTYKRAVAGAKPLSLRYRLHTKNRGTIWVEATFNPVCADGAAHEVIVVTRDVDAVVAREAELAEAHAARERAARDLRFVSENSSDIVFTVDGRSAIRAVFGAVEPMLGISAAEFAGKIDTLIHEDDRQLSLDTRDELIRNPRSVTIEQRIRHADGRWLDIETRFNPVFDSSTGQLRACVATMRDVTARKAIGRALDEARQEAEVKAKLLDSITEASNDILAIADVNYRPTFVSAAADRVLGPLSERSKFGEERVHPDDQESVLKAMQAVRGGAPQARVQFRNRNASGGWTWLDSTVTPIQRPGGPPEEFVTVARDVTEDFRKAAELKQAQLALERSKARMQLILDNSVDVIALIAPDGSIEVVSKSAERLYGRKLAELLDKNLQLIYPEDRERVDALRRREAATGIAETIRFRIIKDDGVPVWVERRGQRISDPETGAHLYTVSITRDITDEMAHERELEQARITAETANRAKSQFLATMSHELRTPMTGIMGMIDLLRASPLTPAQTGNANLAYESAENLLSILNDILDLSKIESGTFKLEPTEFAPREKVDKVMDLLRPVAQKKNIRLGSAVDDAVPMRAVADKVRVRQILFNLVGNAVKFTEQGEVSVHLTAPAPGRIRFDITDTGAGIPADAQANLFKPFVQVDGTHARKAGGTGLGLAICKTLVDSMGGAIGFTSEAGQGSRFWFELPVGAAQAEEPQPKPAAPVLAAVERRRFNVLVAEDHPVNQQLIQALLKRDGHRVTLAQNGAAAVECIKSGSYDLVLMDIQMPVMDGIAATKAIRALEGPEATVPIVALTANALRGDRETYLETGMNGYVSKPIRVEALREAMEEAVPRTGAEERQTA